MNTGASPQALRLSGLDGSTPLGFLAALGVLRLMDHRSLTSEALLPRLSWAEDGSWHALLQDAGDLQLTIDVIMDDLVSWLDDPAFLLAYTQEGTLVDPREHPKAFRDLKPPPPVMRQFLEQIACAADSKFDDQMERHRWRRTMDTAAAFGSEMIQDNKGNTKPMAMHFTAGQQQFLRALAEIRQRINRENFEEALRGPWKGESPLPSLSWDATVARIYALRAGDPSKEKRGSTPGADWLAFIGLGVLVAAPVGRRLETTGVHGGWKDSRFTWPLWNAGIPVTVVRSLLMTRDLHAMTASERRARGITAVFSSRIRRSDQGGYGAFSPAEMR